MKGETERFGIWVKHITLEYAHRVVREYCVCGSKRQVERDVMRKDNWKNGCYVDICAYMTGELAIIAPKNLIWFRERWPNLEKIYAKI